MLILCIFAFAAVAAVTLFLYRISSKKSGTAKLLCLALCFVILACGLEATLFNINYYTSKKYSEISMDDQLSPYQTDDGLYEFCDGRDTFYVSEFNRKINNIYIGISDDSDENFDVEIYLTDNANKNLFSSPERTVNGFVEKSKYINVHTSGYSRSFAVRFLFDEDESVRLTGISVNRPRPFEFSALRVLAVIFICSLVYLFNPSSVLYRKKLRECGDIKRTLCFSFIIIETSIIIIVSLLNPAFAGIATKNYNENMWDGKGIDFVPLSMQNHNQYDELARAILNGRTYIDNNDVPEFLAEMGNPYDTAARASAEAASGEKARWDVAYYNGHYYVYFGIVPLLLMYLPCRALFNAPFPSVLGIIIFSVFFAIGLYKLLSLLAERKFSNISVGSFFILLITSVNCCGMMFLVKRPDFYSVPIITGMTFSVFGIYCWLKSSEVKNRKRHYLFTGSLCMALVAGCRPQMLLLSAAAVPLFFPYFFRDKNIMKKEGIRELALLALPYAAVAAGIMYYNFIRFGSPVDFGSSYNLTTNDVTSRGFDFGRTGLGLFTYLFQPPSFTADFPFLQKAEIETNYVGKTISENCFGGLVTTLPLLWFIPALFRNRSGLKKKKLFGISLVSLLAGLAVVIADTQAGGLLQRYFSDFGFIFFMVSAAVIFELLDSAETIREKCTINTLVFLASAVSVFYCISLVFSVSDVTINTQNPALFTYLAQMVQFWL